MIRVLRFREFVKPARNGYTRPMVVRAEDGCSETVYLKTMAGYSSRPQSAGVEMFTTLLAQRLGLNVPQPVAVDVPRGAGRFAGWSPVHANLLANSEGLNFGTVALGSDWKGWLPGLNHSGIAPEAVEDIVTFDAIVQQTDRESGNPNLMWKGSEIVILDHERVFGYVQQEPSTRPWTHFFRHAPLARHVLRLSAKSLMHRHFGRRVHESLIGLELHATLKEIKMAVERVFPASGVDLTRIVDYLTAIAYSDDFFDYLQNAVNQ